jgi:hypothetical protein
MSRLAQCLIVGTCSVIFLVLPSMVEGQRSQEAIARALVADDAMQQTRAVAEAQRIGAGQVGPELRRALIAALQQKNETYRGYARARWRGEPATAWGGDGEGHVYLALVELVVDMKHPETVDALVGALGTGLSAIRALADFGELAAPAVIGVVTDPRGAPDEVSDGLLTLRFLVEDQSIPPASLELHSAVRDAAAERLSGEQSVGVLERAIDLAVALEDEALLGIVRALARERNEVVARGVDDPSLIERIQEHARDRLAGLPALPPRFAPTR